MRAVGTAPTRVLLAEDDAVARRMLSRLLTKREFEVTAVGDGAEALVAAARVIPDIAIIDLDLPCISGFEVLEKLKLAMGARVSALVLSGMDDPESRVRAFDVGADDFIAKPVHVPELLKRLEAFRRTQRAYVEIESANARIESLHLYAAEASALLAHDLNNGLCVALANIEFLAETPEPDFDRQDALSATLRALRRMAGLVRNFVDLGRLEEAVLKPTRAVVNVGELLTESVALYNHEAVAKNAKISVDCDNAITTNPDPILLERVVHNLLGNAVRYVAQGGVIRISASVEPLAAADPRSADYSGELVVQIGNVGKTIPEGVRLSLFDKYTTGRDKGSRRGMGLYFCRLACEAHGGSIALDPTGEYNANFVVRIPVNREHCVESQSTCAA